MLEFIRENAGSIAIGIMLFAVVAVIVVHMIHEKRSGKSSCGGNCGACGHCAGGNDKNKAKPIK